MWPRRLGLLLAVCTFGFALSACGGGTASSNGSGTRVLPDAVRFAPLAATPAPLPSTIVLKPGGVNGLDNQFDPPNSDAPAGGHGADVDGIACLPHMIENQYHVHAFIGLLVDGRQIAIPDQIGMVDPAKPVNGYTNVAHCFYGIHTHDASGMIHFEFASKEPKSGSLFDLGNVLDIWGQKITPTSFGPYHGPVHIFYTYTALRNLYSGIWTEYTGTDPRSIKIYSHFSLFIEVGRAIVPASNLPRIRFYTEY